MRKWFLWTVATIVILVLTGVGAGYLWLQHTIQKSLPQFSGQESVRGIRDEVDIIRDSHGIPHIYAQNEPDLYFALGYAMAQDRLWQMEFYRRLGHGRLSELFGEDFLETDRFFRLIAAAGLNKEFLHELQALYNAFADGVNAYLTGHRDRLPLEFKLLRHAPEPWTPEDYFAILKVVNWGLSPGWRVDLTAAKILKKVGAEKFRDAFPVWPGNPQIQVPAESMLIAEVLPDSLLETQHRIEKQARFPSAAVSNSWVISARKSVTGKPILANDPHLMLTNPSFWWEGHLVCPTIDVSGYGIAGVPGIGMGRNHDVAWGITNVRVDDVDFYIEKINPANPRQYLYRGKWEDMRLIEETIRVKGKDPVKKPILLTRHGPVLTEFEAGREKLAISVRWTFSEGLQPGKATYLLAKARNISDVQKALRYWELPSQNFVFADTGGNIGFWCSATVPIRSKGDGFLPAPGWTGEYEWQGYVPFEERPHKINPEEGFLATANNRVADENYPYFISNYYEPVDRITRIRQLLSATEKLSVADVKQMQQDVYNVLASELTPKMIRALAEKTSRDDLQKVRELLSQWNYKMEADSVGACLFEMTLIHMLQNIFKDELGDELYRKYLETSVYPIRALRMVVRKEASAWIDDINTSETETLEDIIVKSIEQTIRKLKAEFGNDAVRWIWGSVHPLTFEHPLGKKKPLNYLFNIGPFPVGGSHLTINMRHYPYDNPYNTDAGVSYRMIVDFADMRVAHHVLPTGESGQLGSAHYQDQLNLYLDGKYHPAWLERSDIEKHDRGKLTLKPRTD